MYIQIEAKQLDRLRRKLDKKKNQLAIAKTTLRNIAEILDSAAETDEHGNAAYKADKPLAEIRKLLQEEGYMKPHQPLPGFGDMENDNGEVKIPWEVPLRKDLA